MIELSQLSDSSNTPRREIVFRKDMPFAEYKRQPGMNPSTLVNGAPPGSMLHLHYALTHERADSEQMKWGRAVHCLLFERGEFERRYVSWEGQRRGKKWEAFQEDCESRGVEILKSGVEYGWETALEASLRFAYHPRIAKMIESGQSEVSLFLGDQGLQCKGRVDWISSKHEIVDLKTTRKAHWRFFSRQFYDLHYDIKLGLYQRWVKMLTGRMMPVTVIAMENHGPNDMAIYPIHDSILERGAKKGVDLLQRVKACIESGEWPGVAGDEDQDINVPAWEMDEDDELDWGEI